ncbi:MAG: tRNA (guanosine(46)-N7)-methyltransferase TrmB [Candidatus Wallbacteria bacterium]|nr:tRNA (guanosine(46)-N7)-methyltransferase TrmB [Candidatus Wallbacteria bacterium]
MNEIEITNLPGQLTGPEIFERNAPLCMEIGCGYDSFILKMARIMPECNFIGVELERWVLNKLIRKARRVNLPNVRLLRADAKAVLESDVPSGSIRNFFVNHPDPWPKKRHRQRRLVNDYFLDLLIDRLEPSGKIYYCSDFEDYSLQVAGKLYSTGLMRNLSGHSLVVTDLPDYPRTRFMNRFLALGQPIHFVVMEKI